MNIKIKGIIDKWEVVNQDGSISSSCYTPQQNLITNIGLDLLIPNSGSSYDTAYKDCIKYFAIGTGTSLPLVTDTTLQNETYRGLCSYTAYDSDTISPTGSSPFYITIKRGVETPLGSLDGTYSEIGFSNSGTSNGPLFSKLRLKDTSGNYVTIPISSTQQFRLQYSLIFTVKPDVPDYYNGSYGNYIAGWQNIHDVKKIIYLLTGVTPSGSIGLGLRDTTWNWVQIGNNVSFNTGNYYNDSCTVEDYVSNSHCRYYNVSLGINDATFPLKTLNLYYNINNEDDAMWIMCFDTPLLKSNTHQATFRMKTSWGR
jgi:hypothetical protein